MSAKIQKIKNTTKDISNKNTSRPGILGKQIVESSTHSQIKNILGDNTQNLIINGKFNIWQRGTTQTAVGFGSADRWRFDHNGDTKTVTKEYDSELHSDYMRMTSTSGGTSGNFTDMYQKLENIRSFSNKTVTLSFMARSPESNYLVFEQSTLRGGGGGIDFSQFVKKFKLTPEWKRYTYTYTMPDTIGLTMDNALAFIFIQFWTSAGATYDSRTDSIGYQSGTWDMTEIQLEYSSQFTEYDHRSKGEELELCQRYFQKSYHLDTDPGTITNLAQLREGSLRNSAVYTKGPTYTTRMRTTPTVTLYSPITGASGNIDNSGDKVTTVSYSGESGFGLLTITSGTLSSEARYHFTATAEL